MSSDPVKTDEATNTVVTEPQETVDITQLFEEVASSLSHTDPMICNMTTFNLQDAMAALELMDKKMDCCELPASQAAPFGVKVDENKMVFPRPAPIGLDDVIDPLPWDELTVQDAAYISLECLVRLESLLSGASVAESTFTCLYAHKPVVENMKARLEISSLTEQMQSIMKPTVKGTLPQNIVYASILLMLELTDMLRSIILNADIYEEEDFTLATYNIEVFDDRNDTTAVDAATSALKALNLLENQDSDEVRAATRILGFQVDLLNVCTTMAQLAGKNVRPVVEQAQKLSKAAAVKLEEIASISKCMKEKQTESTTELLRRTFDSYVNRPLVGNAPVRKIVFRDAQESIKLFVTIVKELDWALCVVMLRGNSLGRIRRMLSRLSTSSVNILTRSLLVLNLYFDDKLFGQYSLIDMIVKHMQQLSHIPDVIFENKGAKAFLNRLAKPIYDLLKVQILNRNRQRAYIDAIMLHDWASLRQEAHIVDSVCSSENGINSHFSLYVLYITIDLMDHSVALCIELRLYCSAHELSVGYWYRDFLLSSMITQASTMRASKLAARKAAELQAISNSKAAKGKKKGSKQNRKLANGSAKKHQTPSPADVEDEFEFLALNLKRGLCRGIVRFLAAANQAGIVKDVNFEFTSEERIFEKRFEAFSIIQQPPPLKYSDYVQGSDFSNVEQSDLMNSTSECFTASKAYVDRLLSLVSNVGSDYLPLQEDELRCLAKVCVGNSIYMQKLKQTVNVAKDKAGGSVSFDQDTHQQFCMIKIN